MSKTTQLLFIELNDVKRKIKEVLNNGDATINDAALLVNKRKRIEARLNIN